MTEQDTADASFSVLHAFCEPLLEMNCRCRCGNIVFCECRAEKDPLSRISEFFTPFCALCVGHLAAKKGTSGKVVASAKIRQKRPQGTVFVGVPLRLVWRPPQGKRGHLRKAGSSDRTLNKANHSRCTFERFKLIL